MHNEACVLYNICVCFRYETALTDYKSALRSYLSPDPHLEETREGGNTPGGSNTSTPCGSPKHITDGLQKLSLLSRHDNGGRSGDGPDPVIANFMVNQVYRKYITIVIYTENIF